jgi:hypothetical protein
MYAVPADGKQRLSCSNHRFGSEQFCGVFDNSLECEECSPCWSGSRNWRCDVEDGTAPARRQDASAQVLLDSGAEQRGQLGQVAAEPTVGMSSTLTPLASATPSA